MDHLNLGILAKQSGAKSQKKKDILHFPFENCPIVETKQKTAISLGSGGL